MWLCWLSLAAYYPLVAVTLRSKRHLADIGCSRSPFREAGVYIYRLLSVGSRGSCSLPSPSLRSRSCSLRSKRPLAELARFARIMPMRRDETEERQNIAFFLALVSAVVLRAFAGTLANGRPISSAPAYWTLRRTNRMCAILSRLELRSVSVLATRRHRTT